MERPRNGWPNVAMSSTVPRLSFADHSVLVVEPILDDLLRIVLTTSRIGLHVTTAATFLQARQLLSANPPSLLLTSVRLGIYNGLHLVLLGKAISPSLMAIVCSPEPDPVLQVDAEGMGATFMVKPIAERDLIGAAMQTLFRREKTAPIRPPFERRVSERRAVNLQVPSNRRMADRRQIPWPVTLVD